MAVGCIALLSAMLLTPPWSSFGLAAVVVGAVMARAPLAQALRLPWFWIGIAYGLWILTSCAIAWFQGLDGARLRPPGAAWSWLAAPAVALGLADPRLRIRAMPVLACLMAAMALLAVIQFLVGVGDGPLKIDPAGERLQIARGLSEHHLTFGLACALLLTISAQTSATWAISGIWLWLLRSAAAIGILVCGSRAAMLGAGCGVWATLSARGRRWAVIGLALVVVAGGLVTARLALTQPERLQRTLQLQDGRWPIWRTAVHLFEQRPLTGWGGQDAFKAAFRSQFASVNPGQTPEFANGAPHAHNSALSLASEYGLPAVILCAAFWLTALGWLWRRRHVAPEGWRLGVGIATIVLVGGMFEPYTTRSVQGFAIYAALGLALALGLRPARPPVTSAA